jgi:hypothetical protein
MSPSRPEPLGDVPEAAMLLSLLIEPEAAMLLSPAAGAMDESVAAGAVAAASAPDMAAAEESVAAVFFLQADTAKAAAAIMPAVARKRVLLVMDGPLVMKRRDAPRHAVSSAGTRQTQPRFHGAVNT